MTVEQRLRAQLRVQYPDLGLLREAIEELERLRAVEEQHANT